MRALITGITGQVAPYLAEHLLGEGYEVFGLVRGHGHSRLPRFLFVDGLHDAVSVRGDFDHFAPWVAQGGIVAFHDYSPNFPGVIEVVDDVLRGSDFVEIAHAGDLVAVQRDRAGKPAE